MAKYVTTIESPLAPDAAFDYMVDLRNFAEWDEGVSSVEQVIGDGGGDDAEFDVEIANTPVPMTLRYRTVAYDRPGSATVKASNTWFTSVDTITVESSDDGSIVTYDADLRLNGPLGLFDLLLRPVFARIGERANRGLIEALDGAQVG